MTDKETKAEELKKYKREWNNKWRKEHAEEYRKIQRECHKRLLNKVKNEIFSLLGNKCNDINCLVKGRCRDKRCLQVDHVNGGGAIERRKYGSNVIKYWRSVIEKINSGSKNYQLLCANCNWIKRYNNNEVRRGKRYKSTITK